MGCCYYLKLCEYTKEQFDAADRRRVQEQLLTERLGLTVSGQSGDVVLRGFSVLEQLGLAVDPLQRRLVPADFLSY